MANDFIILLNTSIKEYQGLKYGNQYPYRPTNYGIRISKTEILYQKYRQYDWYYKFYRVWYLKTWYQYQRPMFQTLE